MNSTPRYDQIGMGYSTHRRPEPSWSDAIDAAIGDARSVVNVGAGTGSYEPRDRRVIAIEPSSIMLRQRSAAAAPAVRAVAESLPLPDGSFDVAMAVLTIHHWTDAAAGLVELQRVAHRQVVFTWDHRIASDFWLLRDYVPEIISFDRRVPTLDFVVEHLDVTAIVDLLVPAVCADGVMAGYWRRPEAYLDPTVRANISGLSLIEPAITTRVVDQLAGDLADGTWVARHGGLLERDTFDAGYRLAIAG